MTKQFHAPQAGQHTEEVHKYLECDGYLETLRISLLFSAE